MAFASYSLHAQTVPLSTPSCVRNVTRSPTWKRVAGGRKLAGRAIMRSMTCLSSACVSGSCIIASVPWPRPARATARASHVCSSAVRPWLTPSSLAWSADSLSALFARKGALSLRSGRGSTAWLAASRPASHLACSCGSNTAGFSRRSM